MRFLRNLANRLNLEAKLCLIGSMANGLATTLSDLDLVLVLNDTYLEPHRASSSNNSGESMNIDENSCSNDVDMHQNKVFGIIYNINLKSVVEVSR